MKNLSTVRVGETESVESAIKRFKRKCQKDGIIGDLRKHEQYEKPSVKKKKKQKAAIKRSKKRAYIKFNAPIYLVLFCCH